jgi:hypothetical protein
LARIDREEGNDDADAVATTLVVVFGNSQRETRSNVAEVTETDEQNGRRGEMKLLMLVCLLSFGILVAKRASWWRWTCSV